MKISEFGWRKTLAIMFFAGFALLGPTDLFHTATGVQAYLFRSDALMIPSIGWPWYLPVQMGLIAASVGALWVLFFNMIAAPVLKIPVERDVHPLGRLLIPVCVVMIISGFIAGWATVGRAHHVSIYLALYVASLVFLAFSFSRYYLLAFLLIGAFGPIAEWFLLSPSVGYYEFVQKDLFGRVPAWQLFAYGWGGIFFHYITAGVRRYGGDARV